MWRRSVSTAVRYVTMLSPAKEQDVFGKRPATSALLRGTNTTFFHKYARPRKIQAILPGVTRPHGEEGVSAETIVGSTLLNRWHMVRSQVLRQGSGM